MFLTPSKANLAIFFLWQVWMSQSRASKQEDATIPAVFAFGDSIVDTGNNNNFNTLVKSNFPPYGRDFMGGKPTGRFSNGKVPCDLIAEQIGIKATIPAFLDPSLQLEDLPGGVNFASGGAGFDPLTPELVLVMSLSDQLRLFAEYKEKLKEVVGDERARSIVANGLFIVSSGSDDIVNTYYHTPTRIRQYDVSSYVDLLVGEASKFLQKIVFFLHATAIGKELCRLGARRVGLFGAAPLGCLPSMRTLAGGMKRECVKRYNEAALLFNFKLSLEIHELNQLLQPARLVLMDSYNLVMDIIQNPRNYGFEISDRGCCGSGLYETAIFCNRFSPFTCTNVSKFVFWDSYHPTEDAYRILVNRLLDNYTSFLYADQWP